MGIASRLRLSARPIFRVLRHPILFIMATWACLTLGACGGSDDNSGRDSQLPRQYLDNLNATISRSSEFLSLKESRLDSIKSVAAASASNREKWNAYVTLSKEYRQMETDSALSYAIAALRLSDNPEDSIPALRAELAYIDALSTAGIFPPAMQKLDSLAAVTMSVADRISLWKTARRCYSYIMTWSGNNEFYVNEYRNKYTACDDSLLRHLPKEDPFCRFIYGERLVDEHHWTEARALLEDLLASQPQESNINGMAAYQLAIVYRNNGLISDYAKYLALAAESDIKGCVREGLALPTLANLTYSCGDIDNAFRYVNHTLEDSNSGNIHMHTAAITPIIPLIEAAIHRRTTASHNQMMIYVVVTTVLFLATIILLALTLTSLKKQRQSQEKLAASSRKLESYIGNFISLCSNYSERLEQLSKLVTRKISAGQSDELLKLINSGKFAEDDNQEFFKLIDKALLDIFPDFVAQINSLLQPDKKIELAHDEPLPPELRIYAFVRLGVDQSSRIAKILGYSINTVYSYRNRMRVRALDRDRFDAQVASLD